MANENITRWEASQAAHERLMAAVAGMERACKAAGVAERRKRAADAAYTAAQHAAWDAERAGDAAGLAGARATERLARRRWRAACRRHEACLKAVGAAYGEECLAHAARKATWASAQ